MTDQDVRDTISKIFFEVLAQSEAKLQGELTDESVLLQTGMDSLGFAILVTRLEVELGYDPFRLMSEPYYPVTVGDFVGVYLRHKPGAKAS